MTIKVNSVAGVLMIKQLTKKERGLFDAFCEACRGYTLTEIVHVIEALTEESDSFIFHPAGQSPKKNNPATAREPLNISTKNLQE